MVLFKEPFQALVAYPSVSFRNVTRHVAHVKRKMGLFRQGNVDARPPFGERCRETLTQREEEAVREPGVPSIAIV